MNSHYQNLVQRLEEISHLNGVMSTLGWDQEVMMPPGAADARAKQIAALAGVIHERMTDPGLGDCLNELAATGYANFSAADQCNIREALRSYVAHSAFDPQRSYTERLRRQKDLVGVLQSIAQDRSNHQRTLGLLRGYRDRFNASPDLAYQRYAQRLVEEGCDAFARMHNAMTPAQRMQAVQSLKGYERDFWVLAAQ